MNRRAVLGSLLAATCAFISSVSPVACGSSADDAATDLSEDGGSDATTGGDGAAGSIDAGAARSFKLASGGVQLLVTGPATGFQITAADLATDVDVIEVHQEYYGVPWDSFAAGTPPPSVWASQMQSIATTAQMTNRPIFLSISMLNGERDSLAAKTVIDNGQVQTTDHWAAHCYDFSTAADAASVKAAYLAYVDYMIDLFKPAYLNVAVEVNLFFENCPSVAAGVIDVANAAYDEAKTKKSDVVAFPSIQIDHLYGYTSACAGGDAGTADRETCFEANYSVISPLKRDRFAMSSYPPLNSFKSPSDVPADWFSRGPSENNETPLIAETGWNSSSLVANLDGNCLTVFTNTDADEEAYLDFVLNSAESQKIDVVNWWSDRDLVVSSYMTDCPCTFDPTWCAVLDEFRGGDAGADAGTTAFLGEVLSKAFGTMGLRNYDGTEKPTVYGRWQAALVRPLAK
jgi:hypothetical protein